MKLFKKLLISILVPTVVLAAPFSVSLPEMTTNTSIVLETTKLTDTFLAENIKGTHVFDGFAEYRITNTNTIQARGTYIAGAKTHSSTDHWEDILKDTTGTPLDNIIKISSTHMQANLVIGVLVALSADGDVYTGTSGTTHMTKVPKLEKIADVSVESYGVYVISGGAPHYTTQYCISAIDSFGNLHRVYFGGIERANAGVIVDTHVTNSDRVYKNVYKTSNMAQLPVYVLDSESKLYKAQGDQKVASSSSTSIYKGVTVGNTIASNVKDVSYNGNLYVLTNRGQLFYTESLNPVVFTKNGERETPMIHSIISTSGSSANSCFVYTDMGPALVQADKGYILDFGFVPVDVWYEKSDKGYIMDDQGDVYSFTISTEITASSFVKETKEDWANHNPVIPIWRSVEFNIDFNQIIERNKSFEIVFKVISNKTPIAFNFYYAKSNEVTDRSLWKPIQKNVSTKVLNPVVEETEYKDKNGDPINKITYTYNWKLTDGDMSNIQLIIDPIY